MTTAEQQQIAALLAGLTHEDLLTLIGRIVQQLRLAEQRKPLPLYGAWKDSFPKSVDIDKDIQDIRSQWTEELEEFNNCE